MICVKKKIRTRNYRKLRKGIHKNIKGDNNYNNSNVKKNPIK